MGVQKTPQGIIGRKKPCNSLQIDVWLCLILLLVLVNPTLPSVFFAEGNVVWHPKEPARSCCDFFFCYLRKSPPLSQADTELKNCFFLWCMDIKKKKSICFSALSNWESRDNELVTSVIAMGKVAGGVMTMQVCWTGWATAGLHDISIPSRTEELCALISLVFCCSHFHLLLTFFWDEPLLL